MPPLQHQPDYNLARSAEDSMLNLINSGNNVFSDYARSETQVMGSPVFQYLVHNFWHDPAMYKEWKALFIRAALINRRVRLRRDQCITILGESGTGKEIFARSFAAGRPYVAINCTAMPPELMESELFGHVAGAFTGAVASRRGLLSAAEDGVAFLDEIGDMPVHLQAKLLRVLQERVVRPVGSNKDEEIRCVVVCATHQDCRARLRNDLYWRLMTYTIELPSWSERRDELPWLITKRLDPTGLLTSHVIGEICNTEPLTGNFRQILSLVERAKLQVWMERLGM